MLNHSDAKYKEYLDLFNQCLVDFSNSLSSDAPSIIKEAVLYSVNNGGKRVRPTLGFAAAELLGVDFDKIKYFLLALELVHSYSLVHDDLPAMDNDDYRRGKLSTHKKYGEAIGILAGDSLLNLAVEVCLKTTPFLQEQANAMRVLFDYSGYSGMIGGQVLDLENESRNTFDEAILNKTYLNKTSKLITAPLLMASCLAGGKYYEELRDFGFALGMTFQIIDDVMDVECSLEEIGKTPNKDAEENKLTSIKVFGLEGAKEKAKFYYDKSLEAIKNIPNNEFFVDFAKKLYLRRK